MRDPSISDAAPSGLRDPIPMSAAVLVQGVAIEQYAAVNAALAEPFPLPDVLAVEGLSPDAWSDIETGWTKHLVEDARAAGELLATYRRALAAAEDRLSRRVSPLDDDPAAWVSFLAAFSANPSPKELLDTLGIGMNDLSRLQRRWARRIEEAPSVEKQIVELQKKAPRKLPPIVAEPARLSRSSSRVAQSPAKPVLAEPNVAAVGFEIGGLRLDGYAALRAELAAMPGEADRIFRKYGIASGAAHAAMDRGWREALAKDGALARDFRQFLAHSQERLRLAAQALSTPARQAEMPPPIAAEPEAALQGTVALLDGARSDVLPFAPAAPAEVAFENAKKHAEAVQSPRAPAPADALGATAVLNDAEAVSLRTLPFGPEEATRIERPPPTLFLPAEASQETLSPIDAPPVETLPFIGQVSAAAALESALKHAEAVQRPVAPLSPNDLGETVALGDVGPLAVKSLPFTVEAPARSAEAPPADLPEFTVQQYASLRAELRQYPDHTQHTLARYRVPPEARARLDLHWRKRFAADPALLDAYTSAYTLYQASLAGQRPRNG
jgi:hypothetical protein